ncbi:MAG: VWA domain-containing protein [Deltaproteobacteria bacterium]|nr:MAG: VWA domain-containing protein [Deltaproteobacteria bacterium]
MKGTTSYPSQNLWVATRLMVDSGWDDSFACLERLPALLVDDVITLTEGSLQERVEGVLAWREALLGGTLPPLGLAWPDDGLASLFRETFQWMGLPQFTAENPELTDDILLDWVRSLRKNEHQRREQQFLRRVALEHSAESEAIKGNKEEEGVASIGYGSDASEVREEFARLEFEPDLDDFLSVWEERIRMLSELTVVFEELRAVLGLGWDLSRGLLQERTWEEVQALHQLSQRLPDIKEILRMLGRLHVCVDGPTIAERLVGPMAQRCPEVTSLWVSTAPEEARGITRSNDLSRMLPSEASLLLHPMLRWVWHARRAEQALLTYKMEGLEEVVVDEAEVVPSEEGEERGRPGWGPMVVCLDTSGSMAGKPESVAKALVLEVMRMAHRSRRRCYVYTFSGPEQVREHDLSLDASGLRHFLDFLRHSFSGGTEVHAPVQHALDRLALDGWERADLLLISDGLFLASNDLLQRVERAKKERGFRFHGVQVGEVDESGLEVLCDPVHVFDSWEDMGHLA